MFIIIIWKKFWIEPRKNQIKIWNKWKTGSLWDFMQKKGRGNKGNWSQIDFRRKIKRRKTQKSLQQSEVSCREIQNTKERRKGL